MRNKNNNSVIFGLVAMLCSLGFNALAQTTVPTLLPVPPSPFHFKTNITREPCVFYHYYGVDTAGNLVTFGRVADHMTEQFEEGLRNMKQYQSIIRSKESIKIQLIQMESPTTLPLVAHHN